MKYKSFEDFYRDANIKHLVVWEDNGELISPPFCTDKCKDYSKVLHYKNGEVTYQDVETQSATSKFNSMARVGKSIWFAPYGIWDNFNTVLELRSGKSLSHTISSTAKGQFYNLASNGEHAFASPLGYEEVSFALFIKDHTVKQIPMPTTGELKKHMGTVWCNGHYWSPPRGEGYDYNQILKFNPDTEELSFITVDLPKARRKYSDFIVVGDKLFALPLGRDYELNHILVVDTNTDKTELVELDVPRFVKKYNAGVVLNDVIIAMPYGHKDNGDANHGLVFNTKTYKHTTFDIGANFGGKYRFRSGIAFNGLAVFLPTGTPAAPIIVVDKKGNILFEETNTNFILGRPELYNEMVYTLAYEIATGDCYMFTLDKDFNTTYTLIDRQ
jgi:hypothetical protein